MQITLRLQPVLGLDEKTHSKVVTYIAIILKGQYGHPQNTFLRKECL